MSRETREFVAGAGLRVLLAAMVFVGCLWMMSLIAHAQSAGPASAMERIATAEGSGAPAATPAPAAPTTIAPVAAAPGSGAAAPSNEQLIREGQLVLKAAEEAAGAKAGQFLLWAGFVALLFKFLLDLVRRFGGLLNQQWMRIVTLLLGLGVFLASNLAAGLPWWQALILSLSGPGATVIDWLGNLLLPGKWAAAAVRAEQKASIRALTGV